MLESLFNPDYLISIFTMMIIFSILIMSLNMIIGYMGYLQLGHIGFWSIGAYTYTILLMRDVPFGISLFIAGVVTAFFGFLLGIPTLRLKGHYIGVTSLGFTYIIYSLAINLTDLTRGPLGIPGIPRPTFMGINFDNNFLYLILCLVVALISGFIIFRILKSPFGKILETIREDDIASKSLGKNTFQYKLQTYIISAFFAGISGGLWASFYQFISPYSFFIPELVFTLSALMIGGAGSFWGSVVGSVVIFIIFESVRFLPVPATSVGPMQQLTFSIILILIMLYKPQGIMGKKVKAFQRK